MQKVTKKGDVVGAKRKALDAAFAQIDKQFGKGSVMLLGQKTSMVVDSISSGSIFVFTRAMNIRTCSNTVCVTASDIFCSEAALRAEPVDHISALKALDGFFGKLTLTAREV